MSAPVLRSPWTCAGRNPDRRASLQVRAAPKISRSHPNPRLTMEWRGLGEHTRPRVSWSAPSPTTSLHPLHFLWHEGKQSAGAPTATREGARAPRN
jgi:hypothetical protein